MTSFLPLKQQSSVALVGALVICVGIKQSAIAAKFNPDPLFQSSATYSTTIPRSDGGVDAADIYYPVLPSKKPVNSSLPVVLFLQGAFVDKYHYSKFANIVARYGFVVIVPNHTRTVTRPTGTVTGFLAEQQQVNDVLTYIQKENSNSSSPIANLSDTNTLLLMGHSFGGAAAIGAIHGQCSFPVCSGSFKRPRQLKGAIFYGTNFIIGQTPGQPLVVNNDGIPIGLVQGDKDTVAKFTSAELTYNGIQKPTKALFSISGANHYGITNTNNWIRDQVRPTIKQDLAVETIARWSSLFLRATVLKDKGAFDYVFRTGDALDQNVNVNVAQSNLFNSKPDD